MAVYRADQAQVTFMTEPAAGGYVEMAPVVSSSSSDTATSGVHAAGSRSILVGSVSGIAVGDTIEIGHTGTDIEKEIRQVEHVSGASPGTLFLSAPTAFYHPSGTDVKEVDPTPTEMANAASQYITLIPGVYETVDVPDPEMAMEGRWFLGTTARRNFATVYSGQQTYAGSIGGFTLLNGKALRYPIGQVSSTTTYLRTTSSGISAYRAAVHADTARKGDIFLKLDTVGATVGGSGSDVFDQNSYVIIGVGATNANTGLSTTEIRKHVGANTDSVSGNAATAVILQLDYPLQFDHAENEVVTPVMNAADGTVPATTQTIPYTHDIRETTDLDSVTWHVHMLPSDEDYTKAFDRRYFGGKIGSMSLSAEEGAMVTASWDSVNFLGMIHNQVTHSSVTGKVPFYGQMQSIRTGQIVFPTNEPYYFSNGEVQMFGQTIARIRSFALTVNNNEEPRYYLSKQFGRRRGPTEIKEQRREYTLAVTLALPDAGVANAAQRTLFQELLLEGNYGSMADFIRTGKQGFNVTLTLTRGNIVGTTEDNIVITIPDDGNAATGIHQQGAFIRTAPHNITEDNPFQVEADILFRNLKIVVQDAEHYYP